MFFLNIFYHHHFYFYIFNVFCFNSGFINLAYAAVYVVTDQLTMHFPTLL